MRIWKLLQKENIFLKVQLLDKEAILHYIADVCIQNNFIKDPGKIFNGLETREQTMSTGIGNGIALPHTTCSDAKHPHVILIHLEKPVNFDAIDNKPVDIVLAMIIPENETNLHLQILARVSRLCMKPEFLMSIRKSKNPQELQEKIKSIEEELMI